MEPDDAMPLVAYGSGAMVPGAAARAGADRSDAEAVPLEHIDAILRRLADLPRFEDLVDRFGLERIRMHIGVQLGRMGGLPALAGALRRLRGPSAAAGPGPIGGLLPALMPAPPALPLASVPSALSRSPIDRKVAEIDALGRPPHRAPQDVTFLASRFTGLPAADLHALLSLPRRRSLTNLRYLVSATPPHRSLAFMTALAASHPNVSIGNLVALAHLPTARDGDQAALAAGVPRHVSLQSLVNLATGLPARTPAELIALAGLVPLRTPPQVMQLGAAPAHWTGQDIAQVARTCPARPVADIVSLCQMPAARGVLGLTQFCQAVTPARTAIDLAFLAAACPDQAPYRLAPVAELPGVAGLAPAVLRATAIALDRHYDLFNTAAEAHAALGTPQIAFNSLRLHQLVVARAPGSRVQLMTILNWPHYTSFQNLLDIAGHGKLDSAARLVAWLTDPLVTDGNRLYTVLQHHKIEGAADITYLLGRSYSLKQMLTWINRPWATRAAGVAKTVVNGVVPLNQVPGGGATAGQRYTPDKPSAAAPGYIHHLSMSFSTQGAHPHLQARFTGFHVTWRVAGAAAAGADPRVFFPVAAGVVGAVPGHAGAFPAGLLAAMIAEANALVNRYLPRTNCRR